ncbi:MAG: hypothetical protein JW797_11255 [Bradymonadales bacterium]|nr:hypothetical protein [Bradymonadales bacterium]
MKTVITTFIPILLLLGTLSGCALLQDDPAGSQEAPGNIPLGEQTVALQSVFVLAELDRLPPEVHLEDLYLGVGAIFFEPTDGSDAGFAYANRDPFALHFQIDQGEIRAVAPTIILPEGGEFQISVQLEPQRLLAQHPGSALYSAPEETDEVSLVLTGTYEKPGRLPKDPLVATEPAPLPWRPQPNESRDLQSESKSAEPEEIPFIYVSDRSVRFVLGEVDLESGSAVELVMQVPFGLWVEENLSPALDRALDSGSPEERVSGDLNSEIDLDLSRWLEGPDDDGLDGLIGGIQVIIR